MEEITSTKHTRISWDNYFMNIADVVKTRSLDTKTQVGAVLVSMKDNRIISTGYNSVCAGMDDSLIDWTNRDYVHQIVIHAEMNAIIYAQSKFEDAILYSTLSPCKDCIKLLSATKIRKVIYKNQYRDIEHVKDLCNFFKIELIEFENIF
jgi:dCMP deaminase